MKNRIAIIILSVLLLGSCSKGKNNLEKVTEEQYGSEEEKLLNEAFLQVVGDELYYSISEKYLDKIQEMQGRGIKEAELIKYYKRHRREDSKRIIVFTKNNFWMLQHSDSATKTPSPLHSRYLRQALEHSSFLSKNDRITTVIEDLTIPLNLDSINLKKTGRYELNSIKDRKNVKGEYKLYGSFTCSKIYINNSKTKGIFFYERDCMEGLKCASGTLVLLVKENNYWRVSKEISIYLT